MTGFVMFGISGNVSGNWIGLFDSIALLIPSPPLKGIV